MTGLYKNLFIHNVIAHPLMQILRILGAVSLSLNIHDHTLPDPASNYVSHRNQRERDGNTVVVTCLLVIGLTIAVGYYY